MTAQTAYLLTRAMHEKADRLAEMIPTLSRGVDKATGIHYVTFPSSDDPEHRGHTATPLWCSCRGYQQRSTCTHQVAMIRYRERMEREIIEQAQRCKVDGCTRMRETQSGRCWECLKAHADDLGI